ncbi:MAG: T9SS type A sorting domain-containing protein [Bacteroidetes bacterium]|nr:T9SS type A sorting domain-containing protein [Bacteroidota bacterium]
MNVKYLYLALVCLAFRLNTAQIYFNNRYDLFTKADASADIFLKDSSFFVSCGGLDITQSNLSLSIIKLNKYGVITKTKHYFKNNNWFYTGLGNSTCQLNDSILVSTGYRVGSGSSKSYVYWYKDNLDSIRYLEYGFVNKENVVYNVLHDSIGHLYQIGYVDSSYTNSDILLIKTDTSGNEIWKKKIGLSNYDEGAFCIKQCANGNLLIGGYKKLHGTSTQGPFVMRVDTSGAILWQNFYPSATYANGSFDVMELPNGDIVFTGGKAYNITSQGTMRRPMLTKVDAGGNLIWQKEYGEKAVAHDFFTFLINEKNNFVVSGVKAFIDNSCNGMVYEINQNGDSLFSREYAVESGSQNYFRDLVQAPDKGYVFSGFITPVFANGGTGTQDIWLLKTDSTFCEGAFNCGYPTGIPEAEAPEAVGINIYPNPVKDIVHIDFENASEKRKIEIYDAVGKLILSEDILTQHASLNMHHLCGGVYVVKVIRPMEISIIKKIIKQ